MQATKTTSVLAGLILGSAVFLLRMLEAPAAYLAIVFFPCLFLLVIGLNNIRAARGPKTNSEDSRSTNGNFRATYFPVWYRMLIFFSVTVALAAALNAVWANANAEQDADRKPDNVAS